MVEENNNTSKKTAVRNKYLVKLLPIMRQRGFSHMRIDDIVRFMDISKATFYKYFSSKEEVVELMMEMVIDYLHQATAKVEDESAPYIERFQHVFGQAVVVASYLSDAFLLDVRQIFPSLWERVQQVQQERQRRIQHFYEQGVAAQMFHPINPLLIIIENELVLRTIMEPAFLMEHDETLRSLLFDYYVTQKYQWLVPEVREKVDDAPIKEYIDMMARKISLGIRADFVL